MITTGQTQDPGQYAEVNTVVRVAIEHGVHGVHGAVKVQQHAVILTPLCQLRVGRQTTGQVIVHDDRGTDFLGVLSTTHHFVSGRLRFAVFFYTRIIFPGHFIFS